MAVINIDGLHDYIATDGARRVKWGVNDCCLFVATWIAMATGVDPAVGWRGGYASKRSAHALLKKAGGLVSAVSCDMDLTFRRTDDPMTGDVGIIMAPILTRGGGVSETPVAGIRVPRGLWACKSEFGVAAIAAPHVVAWDIVSMIRGCDVDG